MNLNFINESFHDNYLTVPPGLGAHISQIQIVSNSHLRPSNSFTLKAAHLTPTSLFKNFVTILVKSNTLVFRTDDGETHGFFIV